MKLRHSADRFVLYLRMFLSLSLPASGAVFLSLFLSLHLFCTPSDRF